MYRYFLQLETIVLKVFGKNFLGAEIPNEICTHTLCSFFSFPFFCKNFPQRRRSGEVSIKTFPPSPPIFCTDSSFYIFFVSFFFSDMGERKPMT